MCIDQPATKSSIICFCAEIDKNDRCWRGKVFLVGLVDDARAPDGSGRGVGQDFSVAQNKVLLQLREINQ